METSAPRLLLTWHVLHAGTGWWVDAEAEEAGAADVAALDVPPVIQKRDDGTRRWRRARWRGPLGRGRGQQRRFQDGPGTGCWTRLCAWMSVVAAMCRLSAGRIGKRADTNGQRTQTGRK